MRFNPFQKNKKSEKAPERRAKEVKEKIAEKTNTPEKGLTGESGKYPLGILITPRITEKASSLSQKFNQYVFEVSGTANAYQIRDAVKGKYGVKVRNVNVLNQPGKKVRVGRREGRSKGFKKAIVTLQNGQSIEFT